ncbi:MerR family transcriptional regulator [Pelagibaculum spongiae]|uniref:HTH merR-type domain-containing protein n=1 Tax=Pelagibaculum spongiae TaxID=2080658 RepID=A0A2V1GZ32_9GAMM|nr:MerR family transcriptional regulator [Pelagibaculum spongiae]PVZ66399.1 hypothetical protein DC094_17035 [Pelagibaculum spongiae]
MKQQPDTTDSNSKSSQQLTMTITELSEITTINAVTLRAWERRYGLLNPRRSSKGHRFYTQQDLQLIQAIQQWLARGVPIGKVKPLVAKDKLTTESEAESDSGDLWQDNLSQLLDSLEQLNLDAISKQIRQLDKEYPLALLSEHFFFPLAKALLNRWQNHYAAQVEQSLLYPILEQTLQFKLDKLPVDNSQCWLVMPLTNQVARWKRLMGSALLASHRKKVIFCDHPLSASQTEYLFKGINLQGLLLVGDKYPSSSELDHLLGGNKSLAPQHQSKIWLAFGTGATVSQQQLQQRGIKVIGELGQLPQLLQGENNGNGHSQ